MTIQTPYFLQIVIGTYNKACMLITYMQNASYTLMVLQGLTMLILSNLEWCWKAQMTTNDDCIDSRSAMMSGPIMPILAFMHAMCHYGLEL